MSRYKLRQLTKYIPLHERILPKYPLYWKGNPQLRVFMPLFWMKMVKPKRKQPPHVATFLVHPEMTKFDIKNYLEKIYNVPVENVRTYNERGEDLYSKKMGGDPSGNIKQTDHSYGLEPDNRYAYVELGESLTFEFPDILEGKETAQTEEMKQYKKTVKDNKLHEQKNWDRKDIPAWFY